MVSIRLWTERDIDYVAESVQREGWGHTLRDVERCWLYEPEGCFIAEADGRRVGHVFSTRYDRAGWIGLLVVDPKERGKGIGKTLMQKAISYLQSLGTETINLEAVEEAVPLYRRLGFKEEFDSLRFRKKVDRRNRLNHVTEAEVRAVTRLMQRDDVETVASFDSRYFGANRLRVLRSLYEDYPRLCFISEAMGNPVGYIMVRKVREAHWIGPWVGEDAEIAERLLSACVDAMEDETQLRLGMPAPNSNGVSLMENFNFELTGKSVRMVLSRRQRSVRTSGVYGIGGPEKG